MGTHPSQRHLKYKAILVVSPETMQRVKNWSVGDSDQLQAACATFSRLFGCDPVVPIVEVGEVERCGVEYWVDAR